MGMAFCVWEQMRRFARLVVLENGFPSTSSIHAAAIAPVAMGERVSLVILSLHRATRRWVYWSMVGDWGGGRGGCLVSPDDQNDVFVVKVQRGSEGPFL